jgi:hypothetical protein
MDVPKMDRNMILYPPAGRAIIEYDKIVQSLRRLVAKPDDKDARRILE